MDNYILIRGARQLLTLHGPPGVRRGKAMSDLGVIDDGSVLIRNKEIAAVGPTRRVENLREARNAAVISANGRVVMPGFVDPALRVMLGSTLRASRETSLSRLAQEASAVLRSALQHGTTRAEVKAGGSTTGEELRSLRKTHRLDPRGETLVPTWLIRSDLCEPGLAAIGARSLIFEYVRKKIPDTFLEIEGCAESRETIADLLQAALDRRIPSKLTWRSPADRIVLELLARFPVHAIAGLTRLDAAIISELSKSQAILVLDGGDIAMDNDPGKLNIREVLAQNGGFALTSGYDPVRSPMFNMQMAVALAVLRMDVTAEEALTAATINAAYASGIANRVGSLEYGKDADLLILNLADYRDLPRQFGVNHVGLALRAGSVVFNRIGWKSPRVE